MSACTSDGRDAWNSLDVHSGTASVQRGPVLHRRRPALVPPPPLHRRDATLYTLLDARTPPALVSFLSAYGRTPAVPPPRPRDRVVRAFVVNRYYAVVVRVVLDPGGVAVTVVYSQAAYTRNDDTAARAGRPEKTLENAFGYARPLFGYARTRRKTIVL